MKILTTLFISILLTGCCILCRNVVKETRVLTSGYYVTYTNGVYIQNGPYKYSQSIYYITSYSGGPYAGSLIYPATRQTLNALSLYSYSSAASGDYMLGLPTLMVYPIVLIELPIQFVLDSTIMLPFDLINQPNPPDGWQRK